MNRSLMLTRKRPDGTVEEVEAAKLWEERDELRAALARNQLWLQTSDEGIPTARRAVVDVLREKLARVEAERDAARAEGPHWSRWLAEANARADRLAAALRWFIERGVLSLDMHLAPGEFLGDLLAEVDAPPAYPTLVVTAESMEKVDEAMKNAEPTQALRDLMRACTCGALPGTLHSLPGPHAPDCPARGEPFKPQHGGEHDDE